MNEFPSETVEFQPVEVTVKEAIISVGVRFAIAKVGDRPETWVDSVALGAEIGVMVEGLEPGYYQVWAQVTPSSEVPELPVIKCGVLRIV